MTHEPIIETVAMTDSAYCSHHHHHHHPHQHSHPGSVSNRLKWTFWLTTVYFLVELCGGYWSNSLTLLADAGHMLADVVSLGLSWFAMSQNHKHKATGITRLELQVAWLNGLLLMLSCLWMAWETYERLQHPVVIKTAAMLLIAFGGLILNLVGMRLLHAGQHHNLNLRSAYLHLLSDLLGSLVALVAGLCVYYLGWAWADPVLSIVTAIMVAHLSWQLMIQSGTALKLDNPTSG
jgi:cobalt-zinc-cadmium efflux system protein